jgi:hypothetical protein
LDDVDDVDASPSGSETSGAGLLGESPLRDSNPSSPATTTTATTTTTDTPTGDSTPPPSPPEARRTSWIGRVANSPIIARRRNSPLSPKKLDAAAAPSSPLK